MPKLLDQADIVKANEELTKQVGLLIAERDGLKAEALNLTGQIQALTKERDDALAIAKERAETISTLTTERDALKAKVEPLTAQVATLTTENTDLKAKEQDLEKRTAKRVAELGITVKTPPAPAAPTVKEKNWTEKLVEESGAKDLDELRNRPLKS
jgi:uncharacterized coiled-coil DUF342 family protein